MDAAAYIRVSSPKQNYELQVSAIERMATVRGDSITLVYSEKETGTKIDRPELRRLRDDAHRGQMPRRLYLFALDRLTRTGIVDTIATIRELHQVGVQVVSCSESFDLAGPAAEIVIAVMAWAAEQEVRRQKERRDAKRASMKAQGKGWGRPRKVAEDDPRLARVLELKAQKMTLRDIAQHTGLGRGVVQRFLARKSVQKTGTTTRR